ncbi:uncharacterized protein ARMOST_21656 [Armillaria ostoyae]|uniref:Uncharacterized protein n=1 Tax=Armillaria ostoyae TaxID=47428 RepID=A0A284SAP4_ARMOS|nr:uncharacterized protein ARMOST_21656 [Armillaria ostoyae]
MDYYPDYGLETDLVLCKNENIVSSFFTALRLEKISSRQATWEEVHNKLAKEKFAQQRKEMGKAEESKDEELRVYTLADYPFEEGDTIIVNHSDFETVKNDLLNTHMHAQAYTMYKRVDKKVKPVSTKFPEEACVRRTIPRDPLATLAELPKIPPDFTPTD